MSSGLNGIAMLYRYAPEPPAQACATAGSLQRFAVVDARTWPFRGSVAAPDTDRAEPGSQAQPTTMNCPFDQYPPSIQPIGAAWTTRACSIVAAKQPRAIPRASTERIRMTPPPPVVVRRSEADVRA